jgi:hypothetical protein
LLDLRKGQQDFGKGTFVGSELLYRFGGVGPKGGQKDVAAVITVFLDYLL